VHFDVAGLIVQALAANMRELQGDVLQQQEELQQANHRSVSDWRMPAGDS
jgi:hypothetical protein